MKYLSGRMNDPTLLVSVCPGGTDGRPNLRRGAAAMVATGSAGLLLLAGLRAAAQRRCERVEVTGHSMLPALGPGDRLLVWRTNRIRRGDVVVVEDPRGGDVRWVKRVAAVDDLGIDVRGDRPEESTDSRHVGLVPHRLVVGRVIRRYAEGPPVGPEIKGGRDGP